MCPHRGFKTALKQNLGKKVAFFLPPDLKAVTDGGKMLESLTEKRMWLK